MQEGLYNSILLYTIVRDELIPWRVSFTVPVIEGSATSRHQSPGNEPGRKGRKDTSLRRKHNTMIHASVILMVSRRLAKINCCQPRSGGWRSKASCDA